ncbi:Nucleic acid binding OB-fold tRNA/helicase-type [Lasiodiplodia theobromae]|uniref:Replication factor A protein 2 n=1 Tax=Lasiodiplodia theobromae TaxID=45133 RepID=A0A5N5DBF6_9PEZI|nr:Nucleic acid binding OB-fold tRNA/helicase-type [Lasiodiplodia theobromae]KAB2575021.1 Replication factor A protein 2 [Lasiodiplodia theobromae]KAF4534235.1 Nucleic acid binding OB-fold tRNA/helicase-type [Lasiodiplodia theobromae]KAF9640201.1 Nucleic acid binding OB-fold tRNA/helicase-type [Lasiodiplodia theobromae]
MDYGNYGDYSTTSYGGQGGSGGGGFLPMEGSQSPGSASKGFRKDTLRPVTLKQINDAVNTQESDFTIDGVEVAQITFVGQIRNISQQALNISFKFDDGTGLGEVKLWMDADGPNPLEPADGSKPTLVENTYARVWGKLRSYGQKRHVIAHIIRPITDYNEISYHLLEATAVHLHFTRGPPASGDSKPAANGGDVPMGGYGDAGSIPSHISAAAKKVLHVLRTAPQGNEGLHMQDIASRTGMDMADVAKAGDELLTEGKIYTTVDDTTWALLDV